MPRTPPSSVIFCGECVTEHQRFAKCADGVNRSPRGRGRAKIATDAEGVELRLQAVRGALDVPEPVMDETQRIALMERTNDVQIGTPGESVEEMRAKLRGVMDPEAKAQEMSSTIVEGTGMTVAQVKAYPLITDPAEIANLTPDGLRRELAIRAAIDKARDEHAKREEALGVKLTRPEIMRSTDEKAARILLNQLDHTMAQAGRTERGVNAGMRDLVKLIPEAEAQLTRDTLARIPETREAKRQEQDRKDALRTHVSGGAKWVCESDPDAECYAHIFHGATLEFVRRKAVAEPGWMFVCPSCKGARVRLADQREGVEAA